MHKEMSENAKNAAKQYVELILVWTQANDAEWIVLNRARMIQFNDEDFANEVIHSPQVEQGMTDALALATQLHHPACMMVLFSPARAQRVLNEQATPVGKGVTLLKKLLKLYTMDSTFENQLQAIETLISNPIKGTVSEPVALFYSEVNAALQRQTQHDKLTRAVKSQGPQSKKPSNKL